MEIGILQAIAALHCPFLTAVMLFFTYIGEWGAACIAAAIVLLCFKKTRKAGIVTAIALLADFLIVNVFLKTSSRGSGRLRKNRRSARSSKRSATRCRTTAPFLRGTPPLRFAAPRR